MAGVVFQLPGCTYCRAEFYVWLPPGMNGQFVLNAAFIFEQKVREFCFLGRLNMLPTGISPKITTDILLSQQMCFTSRSFPMQPISFVQYPGILLFYALQEFQICHSLGSPFLVRKTSVYDILKIYVRLNIQVLIMVVTSSYSQRDWLEPRRTALQGLILKS